MLTVRLAERRDVAAMHSIRLAARENPLPATLGIGAESYFPFVDAGCAWVAERESAVLGFAALDEASSGVWALFVDPKSEGVGVGRVLHDALITGAIDRRLHQLRLATAAGTRAETFYRRLGWRETGRDPRGQVLFELCLPLLA